MVNKYVYNVGLLLTCSATRLTRVAVGYGCCLWCTALFVTLTMSMSTMSVIITVLVLYLHHTSRTIPPPRWIQRLAFNLVAPALCMHLPVMNSSRRGRQSAEVVPMTSPTPEVPVDNIDNSVSCGRDISCFQSTTQSCCHVDHVLTELRKVHCRIFTDESISKHICRATQSIQARKRRTCVVVMSVCQSK